MTHDPKDRAIAVAELRARVEANIERGKLTAAQRKLLDDSAAIFDEPATKRDAAYLCHTTIPDAAQRHRRYAPARNVLDSASTVLWEIVAENERKVIDLAAERAMREARRAAQGRTDDIRPELEATVGSPGPTLGETRPGLSATDLQSSGRARIDETEASGKRPVSWRSPSEDEQGLETTRKPVAEIIARLHPGRQLFWRSPRHADRLYPALASFGYLLNPLAEL
jgi:hypothetical protein